MRVSTALPNVQVRAEPIVMAGGLDVVTPPYRLKPGACRAAQNFECSLYGGYRRIAGYERYDGRSRPSDATYAVVTCSSITGGAVGNTLTGSTSGATGKIIAITATEFIVTQTTGTYQAENLNVGAGTIGVSTGAASVDGASTTLLHATYKNLAADVYRALIGVVPGSGSVLGVFLYGDTMYAIRNNAGATAAVLHVASGSGWTAVALGRELKFVTGSAAVSEGATLTGATSGATGTVKRIALRTGSYGGSTAAGSFFFTTITGTFQNGENLQVAGVTKAVANGADTANTLLPGGRFEFVTNNFGGSTTTKRVYGCDGVNRAFEFDGTVFAWVTTGMTDDTPDHITAHLNYLFLSFGASVQYSSVAAPFTWTPVTGAGELGMGDDVTGFQVQPASNSTATLAIFTANKLSILYGTGSSTFQLLPYRDQIGARAWTMQTLAQTLFLDTQGITDLRTVQEYGNFAYAALSNQIKTLLSGWRTTAIASCLSRDLSQYRLLFSNNYAVYVTMAGQKVVGMMPILLSHTPHCAMNDVKTDGTEVIFFGATDGYVYQMDKGTSFDGSNIEAYINLAYNFSGGPRTVKRYRDATLEFSGGSYVSFSFGYELGYGSTDIIQPDSQTITTSFSSVLWDVFTWDQFTWDGQTLLPSSMQIDGEAENISIAITSNSDIYEPFLLTGGVLHYTPRKELRA